MLAGNGGDHEHWADSSVAGSFGIQSTSVASLTHNGEEIADQCTVSWIVTLWLDHLLPFRKLSPYGAKRYVPMRSKSERRCGRCVARSMRRPTICQLFTAVLLLLLLLASLLTYVLFAISSWTPFIYEAPGSTEGQELEWHAVKKKPEIGTHWAYVLCGKYVLQVVLMQYICRDLLRPDPGMEHLSFNDPEQLNTPGVMNWMRSVLRCITCRPRLQRPRWFTTFAADHVLLIVVGFGYLTMQPAILAIKIGSPYSHMEFGPDVLQVFVCLLAEYVGVLTLGFLWMTLENCATAKPGKERPFALSMLVILALWSIEFFVVANNRERFTSFMHELKDVYSIVRVVCALGQVFVTHSLVMLGAVLLGHASHFCRSPDLEWRVALTKGVALVFIVVVLVALSLLYDFGNSWPRCKPIFFRFAQVYKISMLTLRIVSAPLLFGIAWFVGHKLVADPDGYGITRFFDYDTVLVINTYSLSLFYNLSSIHLLEAEKKWLSWMASIGSAVCELGLAVFVLVAWHVKSTRPLLKHTLWLALVLAFAGLIEMESLEDCEISSALLGCCEFPDLLDTHHEGSEMWERCAIDSRCSKYGESKTRSHESKVWCKLEQEGWEVHEVEEEPTCPELRNRWNSYVRMSEADAGHNYAPFLAEENSEEEEGFSSAYTCFKAVGSAGSVEFFFTVIGLLGKLVLMVEHRNSERILQKNQEHSEHT